MNEQTLTLTVSGMLWNRSLVMMDTQTRSLWSHLLGEAMSGPLKGATLEPLPSELTTWKGWLREHPETTVLDMSRTHGEYVKAFYRRPADFVYGFLVEGRAYHATFPVLQENPVLNLDLKDAPLLVTFDPEGASARLFSRNVGEKALTFVTHSDGRMRDEQTGTVWNRTTGKALEGPLAGKSLEQEVGITSYIRAWNVFHSDSREVQPSASVMDAKNSEEAQAAPQEA